MISKGCTAIVLAKAIRNQAIFSASENNVVRPYVTSELQRVGGHGCILLKLPKSWKMPTLRSVTRSHFVSQQAIVLWKAIIGLGAISDRQPRHCPIA